MANYTLTAVEDEVLEALKAELGPRVKTLESYQGDWLADLKQQSRRLPAVLLMLEQTRAGAVGMRSYDLTLDFTLLVTVQQLRGEAEARRQEEGVYQLLEAIRQVLWHQDLGLDLQPFTLVGEERLLNTPEVVLYGAHYRTWAVQDF
jgi:phage gp37-like protein